MTKDTIEKLRAWVRGTRADGLGPLGTNLEELEKIADAIEATQAVLRRDLDTAIEERDAKRVEANRWDRAHSMELDSRLKLEKRIADMERTHMKLPVDADGVPIWPGDMMVTPGGAVEVAAIGPDRMAFVSEEGVFLRGRLGNLVHAKPDTVESLHTDGTCRIMASATDGLCSDNPRKHFKLSCGHGFTLDGLGTPVACAVCGKAVER